MKITVWGARGSIPSPGQQTLRYGGNTTCIEIRPRAGEDTIIVDAGSGLRLLGKNLLREPQRSRLFLLMTHSHWDHLQGFPFFIPAYLSRYHITICGGPLLQGGLQFALQKQMTPPCFPVDFAMMKATFDFPDSARLIDRVGSVTIEAIPLSHPNGGYGYKFSEDGNSFVFLTDNEPDYPHPGGLPAAAYAEFCRGARLLLHDAQYTAEEYRTTRGWGHSTYAAAVELAMAGGVQRLGLFHHDPDRGDDDLDNQVATCRAQLRDAAAACDCFAVCEGESYEI